MMVDPDMACNLELVGNMTHKKSFHSILYLLSPTTGNCNLFLFDGEVRFTDALKTLNKIKLIVVVLFEPEHILEIFI